MADAVATPTVPDTNSTTFRAPIFEARGTISVNGDNYKTGGIALSFALPLVKAQRAPKRVDIQGIAGYIYRYVPGTTVADGKLMIFAQTNAAAEDAPLGELTNGNAIPAAVQADTISFKGEWLGML